MISSSHSRQTQLLGNGFCVVLDGAVAVRMDVGSAGGQDGHGFCFEEAALWRHERERLSLQVVMAEADEVSFVVACLGCDQKNSKVDRQM